jgi:Fe-S-cluster-containing dehydrogenase component/CRP-like cAMP-binding protein
MPHKIDKQNEILALMQGLDIFAELIAQKDKQYEHELDLDVILYGRGYTGGRVGPYVRLLVYKAGEKLLCEGDWSAQRQTRAAQLDKPTGAIGDDQAEDGEEEWDGNSFYVLVDGRLKVEFKGEEPFERSEPGTLVGAMLLVEGGRADATISVPTGAHATVLEFKRPAIRLLRKYPKFAQAFDQRYLEHGRKSALRDLHKAGSHAQTGFRAFLRKMLCGLGLSSRGKAFELAQWTELTELAQFKVYDKNHTLFQTDQPITDIFMIKKGWVELAHEPATVQTKGAGRRGVLYLGPGNCLGLEATSDQSATWQHTATLQARTELLVVPAAALRAQPKLAHAMRSVFADFAPADEEKLSAPEPASVLAAKRQEIMTGLADGTNLLVMDMDLCIRCGNCSLACQHVHGQSRLVRRGIQIERPRTLDEKRLRHVLAPSVCLHCQDPECLTGCPTGAIGRYPDGQIDINPKTCIGCGDCATQCPYNAITLVPRTADKPKAPAAPRQKGPDSSKQATPAASNTEAKSSGWFGRFKKRCDRLLRVYGITPAEVKLAPPSGPSEKKEDFVAIKCNLCRGTSINPRWARREAYSCEENCPTGALVRVNPREYFSELGNVIGTVYVDQKQAIGRNIHRRDWPARFWHTGGSLLLLTVIGATVWAAYHYGLNTPLPGTKWTLRWLTGFAGLVSTGGALGYLLRKQVYRWRLGPLRYWLLAHSYFSVIAAVVFLAHGGWHSGGLLTSALMISFDLVILSGLFGLACYKLAPRIMTRIEGAPLLVEDLRARRVELHDALKRFDASDPQLRPLIKQQVRARFFTVRYLWRQFLRRETLTVLQARARKEFNAQAAALNLDRATHARLIEAVEMAAMTRRVEALIYLHRLLKLWLAPHVAFTVLMLVLLAAHIAQVVIFAVH